MMSFAIFVLWSSSRIQKAYRWPLVFARVVSENPAYTKTASNEGPMSWNLILILSNKKERICQVKVINVNMNKKKDLMFRIPIATEGHGGNIGTRVTDHSHTCLQRPPLVSKNSSRCWQVIVVYVRLCNIIYEINFQISTSRWWSLLTSGNYSKVIVSSGLTVFTITVKLGYNDHESRL